MNFTFLFSISFDDFIFSKVDFIKSSNSSKEKSPPATIIKFSKDKVLFKKVSISSSWIFEIVSTVPEAGFSKAVFLNKIDFNWLLET